MRGASERIEGRDPGPVRGEPNGPRGEGFTLGERERDIIRGESATSPWSHEKRSVSPSIFERGTERRHWRKKRGVGEKSVSPPSIAVVIRYNKQLDA